MTRTQIEFFMDTTQPGVVKFRFDKRILKGSTVQEIPAGSTPQIASTTETPVLVPMVRDLSVVTGTSGFTVRSRELIIEHEGVAPTTYRRVLITVLRANGYQPKEVDKAPLPDLAVLAASSRFHDDDHPGTD